MWSFLILVVAIVAAFLLAFWLERRYPHESPTRENIKKGLGCGQLAGLVIVAPILIVMLWILGSISSAAGGGLGGLCLGMLFAMIPLVIFGNVITGFFAWFFGLGVRRN